MRCTVQLHAAEHDKTTSNSNMSVTCVRTSHPFGILLHPVQSAAVAGVQQQLKVTGMVMQGFVGGAKASIDSVDVACQQVGSSQHLQGVLRAVLAVGNALNTGTARAQANGVKLDSLMKLADMKVTLQLSSTPAKSW